MNDYTETRAADRAKMLAEIKAIAARYGADVEILPEHRGFLVDIDTPSGLQCRFGLSGASPQPDVHVIPWFLSARSGRRLAASFGDVNPCHGCKATHVARGWPALAAELARGLAAAADGTAYAQQETAA